MSSNFPTKVFPTKTFRNVNGERLTLEEKGNSYTDGIINFVLRREKCFKVNTYLALLCAILFVWSTSETSILFVVLVCILTLRYKSFVASTKQDTLLVVKSIGIHIESKKEFGIFSSTKFLPWDTVEDIIINEVVRGQRVLYCLTFIIREPFGRENTRRLIPLFQDLLPERKCLEYINAVQFSYGRELLKIIRRIIKCHPTQGQQFGTQHLLVTYNCTSWTRQDKMFALLKFQQRTNAAAFSHAFVLTIRICPSSEQSLFNLKYPIVKEADAGATFKDLNNSLNTEEKPIKTVIHTTDKVSSEKSATCQNQRVNFQDQEINQVSTHNIIENMPDVVSETSINSNLQIGIEESTNSHGSLGINPKNIVTCTITEKDPINKPNTEFHDDISVNKSVNFYTKRFETNMKQRSIDHRQEQSLQVTREDEIEIKKVDDTDQQIKCVKMQKQCQEIQNVQKCNILSSPRSLFINVTQSGANIDESLSNKYSPIENSIQEDMHIIDNEDSLDYKRNTGENIADSSNIPYQYFIEKEIENAKYNTKSETFPPVIDKMIQKDSLQQDNSTRKSINENLRSKVTKKSNDESVQDKHCNKMPDCQLQENDKQNIPILTKSDDIRTQNNVCKSHKTRKQKSRDSEKKTIVDDKILRSSNITDLVMEGLMFTIRQDHDSVAVIEQKTKLEVDEVLENSEKVETKAGEKCLLNSSLLKLENLVTMIDSPSSKDERRKPSCAVGGNIYSSSFNVFTDSPTYNVNDINYIDTAMDKISVSSYNKCEMADELNLHKPIWQNQSIYSSITNNDSCLTNESAIDKKEHLMEWEYYDNKQDKERTHKNDNTMEKDKGEQEEHIIPEFLQSTIFSSERTISNKQFVGLQNKDLSIDDMNVKKTNECDTSMKGYNISLSLCPSTSSNKTIMRETSIISEESKSIKRQSNAPRVVSNKAITVEQMPLALQKVLRHTCRKHKLSSTNTTKVLSTHQQKMQCKKNITFTENASCEAGASSGKQCMDSNTVSKSLSIETSINTEINNKADLHAINNKNALENDDNARNNKKSNETHCISQTSSSLKHSLPRKLQDITEDFYYDLHAHKNNAIRQRCLRQRRRPINNPNDIKNGKVRIEMLKFIQDMTEGAKVVVERLNIGNKSSLLEKNTISTTYKH